MSEESETGSGGKDTGVGMAIGLAILSIVRCYHSPITNRNSSAGGELVNGINFQYQI